MNSHDRLRYCFYRYHLPDPVYFRKEIRATIQQIGCWDPPARREMYFSGNKYLPTGKDNAPIDLSPAGVKSAYGLFERTDDWSSCAYFYLDRPTNELPPLVPLEKRTEGVG